MRDGFGRSVLLGLVAAGTVAGGMTIYRRLGAAPPPAPPQPETTAPVQVPSSPPPVPRRNAGDDPTTIDLGNLGTIGTGAGPPRPSCDPDGPTPPVSLEVTSHWRPTPPICNAARSLGRAFDACFKAAVDRDVLESDLVELSFDVDARGRLGHLAVDEETHDRQPTLGTCLLRVARRLRLSPGHVDEVRLSVMSHLR